MTEVLDLSKKNSKRLCKTHADYYLDLRDLNKEFKNVFMYEGNSVGDEQQNGGIGKWEVLKPGYGVGFSTDGIKNNYSNRFGIELSFAKNTKE